MRPPRHHTTGDSLPPRSRSSGIRPEDFREGFGEDLSHTLDLRTWHAGRDLAAEYDRLRREVEVAVQAETDLERRVRSEVYPSLACVPGAPADAGRHEVSVAEVEATQQRLLFNGQVEAAS